MSHRTSRLLQVVVAVTAAAVAQVAATAVVAAADTLAAAIAVATIVAIPVVIAALAAVTPVVAATVVASARLIAHRGPIRLFQRQTLRHVHLIVHQWIVRVMAKTETLEPLRRLIVMRLRVVNSPIVANVRLHRVKNVHPLVMVLIVLLSLIEVIVVAARSVLARVTVNRVQPGAAMIAPRRVVTMVMPHLRNVVNSRRVSSAPTVRATMICRFSVQHA